MERAGTWRYAASGCASTICPRDSHPAVHTTRAACTSRFTSAGRTTEFPASRAGKPVIAVAPVGAGRSDTEQRASPLRTVAF
jgi:hypothetical protein